MRFRTFLAVGFLGIGGQAALGQGVLAPCDSITTMTATLPTGRSALSCATDTGSGKIYCFGGEVSHANYTGAIEEYDAPADTLATMLSTLPSITSHGSCVASTATGKIYCFGGTLMDTIVEYDPDTDTPVTKSATLPSETYGHSCAEDVSTGVIYCFGGFDGTRIDRIVGYDPATDTRIDNLTTLPSGRYMLSCVYSASTGMIYCFGGADSGGNSLSEIIEYDPANDIVVTMSAALPDGRDSLSCVAIASTNHIYCFGGAKNGMLTNEIVEYNPLNDTLLMMSATLPSPVVGMGCTERADTVYCFGGRESVTPDIRTTRIVTYLPPECDRSVPTVSEWGLAALTLLVLVGGTLLIARPRRVTA